MKREDIKAIFAEATDEQLKKVMDLNGADVEKLKGKVTALEAENTEKKSAFDKLKDEFEALKSSNAAAEDYKTKLETLKADIDQKEEAAKEEREKAEREADILNRYEAAAVDKDGNPLTLLDIMSVDDNIIDNLDLKLNSKKLGQFIREELNEREQKIIVLRYGLDGKEAMTQKSVAKMLGISRSYVSRIETKALKQLRKRFETSSNL